ncbi:hypothetical protein WJX81_002031 [Elliptochloris bilobata]|uniref:tRNA nucleotidyltransferase/poly(A) polymerase RNA and SrmB- binding domain-containing protein n=1 Tax=Elliptochloris bilobata TaxID=381761 RepID=A0AAW1RMU0_9CHLO
MFSGPAPVRAVSDIQRMGMFPAVFTPPPALQAVLGDGFGAPCSAVMAAAEALLSAWGPQEPISTEERRLALLAALLLPLRAAQAPAKKKKGSAMPVSAHIVREAIKWRTRDADAVAEVHGAALELLRLHARLRGPETGGAGFAAAEEDVRVALGRLLRRLGKLGLWRTSVLLAPLLAMPEAAPLGVDSAAAAAAAADARSASPEALGAAAGAPEQACVAARAEVCRDLESAVGAFGLEGCWAWKPLLDGREVMAELRLPKGPQVGAASARVLDWQLAHPTASAEDCRAWLRSQGPPST